MRGLLLICAMVVGSAGGASAAPGLTLALYGDIPFYDYYPTDSTIDREIAYAASVAPDSRQAYVADPSGYSVAVAGSTIADFTGSLIVSAAGFYNFTVNADDAARIMVDGQTVVEADFYNNGLSYPSSADLYLSAGTHLYESFYFQTVGGADYRASISGGPADVAFDSVTPATDVPEPASMAMLGLGAAGVLASRRRESSTTAEPTS